MLWRLRRKQERTGRAPGKKLLTEREEKWLKEWWVPRGGSGLAQAGAGLYPAAVGKKQALGALGGAGSTDVRALNIQIGSEPSYTLIY